MSIQTNFEGLGDALLYFKNAPERSAKAARLAINQVVARKGLPLIADMISAEVDFPKGYLKGDRLRISQYAKENNLEAVIIARKRATSLARFASGGTPLGSKSKSGVTVQVKRGGSVHLKRAWLVRLKKGASLSEDQFNVGLAVRLGPGESLRGKYSTHKSWLIPGVVALLYGPSVDQVFRGVADDAGPLILNQVADEFFRQYERL